MKIFITGEIVNTKIEGCFSPIDLREILESVDKNEPLEVEITSEGGSVFAGVQIANMLARHQGKVTTHAVGICASIATIILMAGDEVAVDDNCFCMIHRPWSWVEGNADDMAKEIDALNKCETAMMGYYMKWSKVDSSTLSQYLADESWFLGEEFAQVFECNVIPSDKVFNIAASLKECKYTYKNIPTKLKHLISDDIMSKKIKNKTEVKNQENSENPVKITKTTELTEKTEETEFKIPENPGSTENPENPDKTIDPEDPKEPMETTESNNKCTEEKEETKSQDPDCPNEDDPEVLKLRIKELETEIEKLKEKLENGDEMVSKNECEKRVSGMQASMQKQINDFVNQLKVKNEELISSKNEITSLKKDLETSNSELSSIKSELEKTTSALVDKTNKLDALNAGVLKKPDQVVDWRNLKGKEFWNYLKQHPEIKNAN